MEQLVLFMAVSCVSEEVAADEVTSAVSPTAASKAANELFAVDCIARAFIPQPVKHKMKTKPIAAVIILFMYIPPDI